MRMKAWPKNGQTKRIYLNTGGRWSVDTWLEPSMQAPGWQLQIKLKDAEAMTRRVELHASIESFIFDCLSEAIVQHAGRRSLEDAAWEDWLQLVS